MCLRIIILLTVTCFLVACTKHEGSEAPSSVVTGGSGDVGIVDNHPPEVVSGTIFPSNPTAGSPLVLQYIGRDQDGDPIQYRFRWYIDGAIVREGPDGKLEPGEYAKGSVVFAEIIPFDEFNTGAPYRTAPVTILNQPPVITSINLTPLPVFVGGPVTAEVEGFDADGDSIIYAYQWKVNGKGKAMAENTNSLDTKGLRKGDVISVIVTPSDGESQGKGFESGAITLSNSAPRIVSSPPSITGGMIYTYQVIAKDPDGDSLSYSLAEAPAGMTINPSTGLVRWEVPKDMFGGQGVSAKIVVDDHDGGIAVQEFSLSLETK